MKVKVYIATTEGPALIQRVTEEDPEIPSVVCLNGTTETLAISDAYGRFVRKGSGVVAGLTGHDSYRVDVETPIDGGQSWQFGMLLAHLLQQENRLAGPDEPGDLTVFATGEVDRDLNLRSVGHIAEKARTARARMDRAATPGAKAIFLMPDSDALGQANGFGGEVFPLASVFDAAAPLQLTSLAKPGQALRAEPAVRDITPKKSGIGRWIAGLAGVIVLASAAVIAVPDTREALEDWVYALMYPSSVLEDPETTETDGTTETDETANGESQSAIDALRTDPKPQGETAGETAGETDASDPPAPEVVAETAPEVVDPPAEPEAEPETVPPALTLIVQEERAPAGFTCKSLRFAQLDTIAGVVHAEADGSYLSNGGRGVCEIAYRVVNEGPVPLTVTVAASIGTKSFQESGLIDPAGFLVVPLDFARIESGVLDIAVSVSDNGQSDTVIESRHIVRP